MLQELSHVEAVIDPPRGPVTTERLGVLCEAVEGFLERCCHASVIGPELAQKLDGCRGGTCLDRLLAVYGFESDPAGFFADLATAIEGVGSAGWTSIRVNGVAVPHALLLAVLEILEPGDDLIDITSIRQLEDLLRRPLAKADRGPLQEVLDRFPVRLSRHSLRQLRLSPMVGRQYLPFVDELSREGLVHTWVGQFHSGVIERMYHNRVIMILNMNCPVYCRFCFRKHKVCRQESPPTRVDVRRGVDYIRSHPEITEVVLTGGDPFMNRATLTCAVEGLLEVEHIQCLRLATRSLSYHPALFTQRDGFWLSYLKGAQREAERSDKRIEIATHFIHPDELSLKSLDLIAELTSTGIAVYVQTPLLGGINDGGHELLELYSRLRRAGAEMHYIFMPCSPLQGNRAYRSTLDDGMRLAASLRANLSDRAMPRFCTATAFGKIDWGTNGWVVEEDPEDNRFLWLRTPYAADTFTAFTPDLDLGVAARGNDEGTLDARFMVGVGDRRWLRGPAAASRDRVASVSADSGKDLSGLAQFRGMEQVFTASSQTVSLRRVHATRAELDCAPPYHALEPLVEELCHWKRVTDVVLWSSRSDPLQRPRHLARVVDCLAAVPQITAIRIRSQLALATPERVPERALEVLTSRNRLGVVDPLRVELELNAVHPSELNRNHGELADRLRKRGVTAYNTTLMLAGVNCSPTAVRGISSSCRRYGIEFHHLVVAGDPAQRAWNRDRPVKRSEVVEITSELRRVGGGRELPRFVIKTALGEGDLGTTADLVENDGNGGALVRLLHSTVNRDRKVEPWGELPAGSKIDPDGHPIVGVPGLRC
jgi:L-lysine 2,3-aminomutase